MLEFRDLLLRAPLPEFKALPTPKADPARGAEAMSQVSTKRRADDPNPWQRGFLAWFGTLKRFATRHPGAMVGLERAATVSASVLPRRCAIHATSTPPR